MVRFLISICFYDIAKKIYDNVNTKIIKRFIIKYKYLFLEEL